MLEAIDENGIGKPGDNFINGFIGRHRDVMKLRLVSNASRKRASVNVQVLTKYFNLEKSLEGISNENIFNYDETYATDNSGEKHVLFYEVLNIHVELKF